MSNLDVSPIPTAMPEPRRPKRWKRRLLFTVLTVSLLANLATCATSVSTPILPKSEFPQFVETLEYGAKDAEYKAVMLYVDGVIMHQEKGGFFGPVYDPVDLLLAEIQAATVDEEVDALFVQVNSPGGGVTASDEIYHALLAFKQARQGRKILVLMKDLAASGGYYVSMAADEIIAQPTTVLGSVGVILSAFNAASLAERIGIQDVSITSGPNKAMLSPLKQPDPEQTRLLEAVVEELYQRFLTIVLESRKHKLNTELIAADNVFDGRIVTADVALKVGLVDAIGYSADARSRLQQLLGGEVGFHTYSPPRGLAGALLGLQKPMDLPSISVGLPSGARFLFLWKP